MVNFYKIQFYRNKHLINKLNEKVTTVLKKVAKESFCQTISFFSTKYLKWQVELTCECIGSLSE